MKNDKRDQIFIEILIIACVLVDRNACTSPVVKKAEDSAIRAIISTTIDRHAFDKRKLIAIKYRTRVGRQTDQSASMWGKLTFTEHALREVIGGHLIVGRDYNERVANNRVKSIDRSICSHPFPVGKSGSPLVFDVSRLPENVALFSHERNCIKDYQR